MEGTMSQYYEFCPRCGVPRPLQASTETVTEVSEQGDTVKVKVLTLHCAICHSFVRTERRPESTTEHREGEQ